MPLPAGPVVGTCGFAYPEWRGRFYPPELAPGEWLGFYAQVFEALELDGTFYRPPESAQVAVWAEALPDRFAVAAKVPRAITHEARLEGEPAAGMLRAFAHALQPLGDRLLAVVLQLPPSLDAGEGRDRLARLLGGRPDGLPVVVEVRHRSWDRPWLQELLAALWLAELGRRLASLLDFVRRFDRGVEVRTGALVTDPSLLTTEAMRREIEPLRELLESQIGDLKREFERFTLNHEERHRGYRFRRLTPALAGASRSCSTNSTSSRKNSGSRALISPAHARFRSKSFFRVFIGVCRTLA